MNASKQMINLCFTSCDIDYFAESYRIEMDSSVPPVPRCANEGKKLLFDMEMDVEEEDPFVRVHESQPVALSDE